MFFSLLKGCMIGLSIAMPVGPIGLLCIRNSLARGMTYGLMSGLGAACADTLFGALGGFGISAISIFLTKYQIILELVGAFFLFYLGISTFFEKNKESTEIDARDGHLRAFISTFFLTLTNPMTILSFAGVYAGLGVGSFADDILTPFLITIGVFLGSLLWWLTLSTGCSYFKDRLSLSIRYWLNRISGMIIFGFGLLSFTAILSRYFS